MHTKWLSSIFLFCVNASARHSHRSCWHWNIFRKEKQQQLMLCIFLSWLLSTKSSPCYLRPDAHPGIRVYSLSPFHIPSICHLPNEHLLSDEFIYICHLAVAEYSLNVYTPSPLVLGEYIRCRSVGCIFLSALFHWLTIQPAKYSSSMFVEWIFATIAPFEWIGGKNAF